MKLKKPMYSPSEMEYWWTYAKHLDFNARWSLFGKENPHTIPDEILAYLANDDDWVIRVEVAAYSKTPVEILKHLVLTDDTYSVIASVFQNPNCTDEIRLLYRARKKYGHLMK
jgi:hypothetical protein